MTFLYPLSAHLLYMHYWAAIINSICTYKNKNQKILIISKFPAQKPKSSFHMPKNYLGVYPSVNVLPAYINNPVLSTKKFQGIFQSDV